MRARRAKIKPHVAPKIGRRADLHVGNRPPREPSARGVCSGHAAAPSTRSPGRLGRWHGDSGSRTAAAARSPCGSRRAVSACGNKGAAALSRAWQAGCPNLPYQFRVPPRRSDGRRHGTTGCDTCNARMRTVPARDGFLAPCCCTTDGATCPLGCALRSRPSAGASRRGEVGRRPLCAQGVCSTR